MVVEITETNVPYIYPELLQKLRVYGKEEESRNGKVLAFEDPILMTIIDPKERVLFDPIRDANPFFHVMEFIWMMAGSNDVNWIERFNSNYRRYADGDVVHGAYGHRWQHHFSQVNQITAAIDLLKRDKTTRRAVLGMWDPGSDLSHHNDLPCNTHIYFRYNTADSVLDMTVCNRSNDILWGMLGANVVHMTYLQELICLGAELDMGMYRVFSNNAHVYKGVNKYEQIIQTLERHDPYTDRGISPFPLLQSGESVVDFLLDCSKFVKSEADFKTMWMYEVAIPMYNAWMQRKNQIGDGKDECKQIGADDWRLACEERINRR